MKANFIRDALGLIPQYSANAMFELEELEKKAARVDELEEELKADHAASEEVIENLTVDYNEMCEKVAELELLLDVEKLEVKELERLAEIGKAVEFAIQDFQDEFKCSISQDYKELLIVDHGDTWVSLMDWYREEVSNGKI